VSAARVIQILWSERRDLSEKALESLASAAEPLAMNLGSVAETMEGIACLVAEDEAKGSAGTFQNADSLFEMLCGFSASINAIAAAISVTSEAKTMQIMRLKARLGETS